LKFIKTSLKIRQVLWLTLDFLKLSRLYKQFSRRKILNELQVENFNLRRLVSQEFYLEYISIFRQNIFHHESRIWKFNSQKFHVDYAFIHNGLDKSDYTYRMIFMHCEWMFNNQSIDLDSFIKLHCELEKSDFFYHPSCTSQRAYVLIWTLVSKKTTNSFHNQLVLKYLKVLILNTEEYVYANHLIDNYLAIIFLANFACLDSTVLWACRKLKNITLGWVEMGYYPEKTPCYQSLLAGRTMLVIKSLEVSDVFSKEINYLNRMHRTFLSCPDVHLNDSYLPIESWKKNSYFHCPYATSLNLEGGYQLVLVDDATPDRGYMGHAHDASGSFYIYDNSCRQLIGGRGTSSYRISSDRDFTRSAKSYCSPRPKRAFVNRLNPWLSFRNTFSIKPIVNKYSLPNSRKKIVIIDKLNDGYSVNWFLPFDREGSVIASCNRESELSFWSDFQSDELFKFIFISGDDLHLESFKGSRFNGIGNEIECYEYHLSFSSFIEFKLV
jgi:hypothetical protein